jgi:hypothetical protein
MNDLYEKWWLEPSTRLGWHKWDGEVNLFWLEGAKSAGKSSIQAMSLFSQSLQLGWRPLLPLRLWTNLRHLEIQSATDLGSWLSEGYPPGTSWRSQTGIEWNIKESIQASADWIVRLLPDQPLEQKLSLQAQALF